MPNQFGLQPPFVWLCFYQLTFLNLMFLSEFAYVEDLPAVTGRIRVTAEDFQVEEELSFAPSGAGEHVLLHIRKRHTNTEWLAGQLAKWCGVKPVDVSYAGLKDRHAVTTQWFSIRLAGRPEPDWQPLNSSTLEILQVVRHHRKLRRGALRANHFVIVLRDLQGDLTQLESRLQRLAIQGVPNYFGEQRFGHEQNNLAQAAAMLEGELKVWNRHKRSLYLSAVRSWLFNTVLSARVHDHTWNQAKLGDVMQLANSHALFLVEEINEDLVSRLRTLDIHPTGPLWGRGNGMAEGEVAQFEQQLLADYMTWRVGLEHAGLQQERRALRLAVENLSWEWLTDSQLKLRFKLSPGSYATTVLREILQVDELSASQQTRVGTSFEGDSDEQTSD